MNRNKKNNNQTLMAAVGKALYGARWQSDLARDLGLSDARRMRAWMTPKGRPSYRPIPPGVWADLAGLLRRRKIEIEKIVERLADLKKG